MENQKFNFGKSKVSQSQKTKMVQNVFNKVTKKYNLMNDIMSFGTHRLWKKRLIQVMNIQSNDLILDVGTGTSDITNLIHNNFSKSLIISLDLNFNMLNAGKEKTKNMFFLISGNIIKINFLSFILNPSFMS